MFWKRRAPAARTLAAPGRRGRWCLALAGLVTAASVPLAGAAVTTPPTLAAPGTLTGGYETPLPVTGITLDAGGHDRVQVQLATTGGSLSLDPDAIGAVGFDFVTGDGTADTEVHFRAAAADAQAALTGLVFTPAAGYLGEATVTYRTTVDSGLYNPDNDHFYEYVAAPSITWQDARLAAEGRSMAGLQGYLVSVTSPSEQDFVTGKLPAGSEGWMGATDEAAEGTWIWATGPEAGTTFWMGDANGSPVDGRYSNWASGEPNDWSGEDHAHFLPDGRWNDYLASNPSVTGYLVEYGGMPGDPVVVDDDVTTITVEAVAPSAPQDVATTPGDGQLTVTWTAPSTDGGSPITGYEVRHRPAGDGGDFTVVAGATSPAVVTGLVNGTTYELGVVAVNAKGESPAATATATPRTIPGPPSSPAAVPGDGTVSVTWSAPADDGGDAVTGYRLRYRPAGDDGDFTLAHDTDSSAVVSGLVNGTAYDFHVSAANSAGWGEDALVSATPRTTSSAPASVAAAEGNRSLTVTWSASESDGGAAITGYRVEYRPDTGGGDFTVAFPSTTAPATITGLVNGTAYEVRVSALNPAGAGAAATVKATPSTHPAAPADLSARPGEGTLTVSWSAPADSGGRAITGYLVQYRPAGTFTWLEASASASSPVTIGGLTNGTSYEVRVRARTSLGDGAASVASATPRTKPGAPGSVRVTPSTTRVVVSWAAPAFDGGAPVTGYRIDYRRAGSDVWNEALAVASSPATVTGLTYGTGYELRIRPRNAAGLGASVTVGTRTLAHLPSPGATTGRTVRDGRLVDVPVFGGTGPVASIAGTASGNGSWSASPDGGVFTAGDATFHGSLGGSKLRDRIVGITPTPTAGGYYLAGRDGGVFAFGDAAFFGSAAELPLNQPVEAVVPTCAGTGYYLVAGDGGVFAFGDAGFFGSMGGTPLNKGMIGIVPTCSGMGYWTFAADGGVFAFGDARFWGSLGGSPPAGGVVAMVPAVDGRGYWLIGADGEAHPFGSAGS